MNRCNRHPSFTAFFRSSLMPALERFERVRRIRLPLLIVVPALFALAVAAAAWSMQVFWLFLLVPAGFFLLALEETIFLPRRRRVIFSRDIVRPLVAFAVPRLASQPGYYVGQGDFMESELYGHAFNRYEGRDYFKGRRRNYQISFSWIKAGFSKNGPSVGNRPDSRSSTVFTGWFFVATFPRKFVGRTVVQRDVAEASLGWFGRSLQSAAAPDGLELVLLEDADFEARFKILSSGQLDARYVLSPALMRLAVRLDKRTGGAMSFSFYRSCMFAAIPSPVEYFTWRPVQPFTDPAFCRQLYHAVRGVEEMAQHIASHQAAWLDNT